MILEEMMFSVSETGKIEKLLSISITDLKGGDSMNRIKKIREKRGLTQKQLSEMIMVNQSTVAMWETEKSVPRASNLLKLSNTLNCSVDELLRRN